LLPGLARESMTSAALEFVPVSGLLEGL